MMGWMLFVTLLIYVVGLFNDMQAGLGNAFGWPSPRYPWAFVNGMMIFCWVLFFLEKFHAIKFWFQR